MEFVHLLSAATRSHVDLDIRAVTAYGLAATKRAQVVRIRIVRITVVAQTCVSGRRVIEITRGPASCVVVKGNHQVAITIVSKGRVERQRHPAVNGFRRERPCENDVC